MKLTRLTNFEYLLRKIAPLGADLGDDSLPGEPPEKLRPVAHQNAIRQIFLRQPSRNQEYFVIHERLDQIVPGLWRRLTIHFFTRSGGMIAFYRTGRHYCRWSAHDQLRAWCFIRFGGSPRMSYPVRESSSYPRLRRSTIPFGLVFLPGGSR